MGMYEQGALRHGRYRHSEAGNATAEFVMITSLVLLLFAIVLQISFALYAKNMMIDAASAGARYGTLADRTPAEGAHRARERISATLPAGYATAVTTRQTAIDGHPVLEVQVAGTLPVLGPFGFDRGIEVTGKAVMTR